MENRRRQGLDYGNRLAFKGWMFLKNDELRARFRQPNLQGVLESMLPLAVAHLTASYTRQWLPFCNLVVVWATSILGFFSFDFSDDDTTAPAVTPSDPTWH